MKKLVIVVLALVCILSLVGCTIGGTVKEFNNVLSNEDTFIITNRFTGESNTLLASDGLTIADVLEKSTWNIKGTTECASNIEVIIKGVTYKYHSDCGTFNDSRNQRNLSLDGESKEKVNAIFAEYVSLTSEDRPVR